MERETALRRVSQLIDVSRETLEKLERFADLLVKWNAKINLVSPATLPDLWERHILDSAQLVPFIPDGARNLVDIGTGGGFPGLIIGIIAQDTHPALHVTMIESDIRKCAFLQTTSAQLGLKTTVSAKRIEAVDPLGADVLTSRALAAGPQLLAYAHRHLAADGKALLLKGTNAQAEIDEALATWSFDLQKRQSETSADAVVLDISNLRPR